MFRSIVWGILCCATSLCAGKSFTPPLREEVSTLSLEVSALQTEVHNLIATVQSLQKEVEVQKLARDTLSDALREKVQKLVTDALSTYVNREELVPQFQTFSTQVSEELTALAERFQVALNRIIAVLNAQHCLSEVAQGTMKNPGEGIAYEVKAGETLEGIAKKFDTTVETLEKLNFFPKKGQVTPGQMLFIPIKGAK
ncbi:MAG: LysM peptidoglycan-binding domain-containing protein [Opitutales bacterium]|nr:LysM peptidoglycan-binding domain-containing protein [Opitutales bacterium]